MNYLPYTKVSKKLLKALLCLYSVFFKSYNLYYSKLGLTSLENLIDTGFSEFFYFFFLDINLLPFTNELGDEWLYFTSGPAIINNYIII